jgi:hypothetical protein
MTGRNRNTRGGHGVVGAPADRSGLSDAPEQVRLRAEATPKGSRTEVGEVPTRGVPASEPTARRFDADRQKLERMASGGRVPSREIFGLAKRSMAMSLVEVARLLNTPEHDNRVGAVAIMDFQARHRTTTEANRRALYELYLANHD